MPEVTTYSPGWAARWRPGSAAAGLFGSPTFGWTMPVELLLPRRAETPIELSVIRSTCGAVGGDLATLPTSPSALTTGSFDAHPGVAALVDLTVEYHRFGDLPMTSPSPAR